MAESLFRKATGDHRQAVTAAIFWLKTRAGWKEASVHEVNGGSVQARIDAMRDEELDAAIAELQRQLVEHQSSED